MFLNSLRKVASAFTLIQHEISDFLTKGKKKKSMKESLLNKQCWNNCINFPPLNEPWLKPTLYPKFHSKWTTDINVKCKTVKLFWKEYRRKSSWPTVRQQILQYDTKGMIDLLKVLINEGLWLSCSQSSLGSSHGCQFLILRGLLISLTSVLPFPWPPHLSQFPSALPFPSHSSSDFLWDSEGNMKYKW